MKIKILKPITLLLMLITLMSVVCAEQQGNLPVDYFQLNTPSLRYVDGGLCDALPDDAGTTTYQNFEVWCLDKDGSSNDLSGCVAHFRRSDRKLIQDVEINPGQYVIAPADAAFWERYNCHEEAYTCGDYQSIGCGKSGSYARCDDDEMLRTRSCSSNTPSSMETERCIPWYECMIEHCDYDVGSWSSCQNSVQTRTVTDIDCSTWTEYQYCQTGCSNPSGVSGDIQCIGTQIKECTSTGAWDITGECNTGTSQSACTNPTASPNDKVCINGFEKICQSTGNWANTGEYCTVNEDIIEVASTAFYDPTRNGILGRVELKNTGEDMKDTNIIEMQVRPKGDLPLAFQSNQMTCDVLHQENVHKQFMLKSGESTTIDLFVSKTFLPDGEYDVWMLSRHKCYKDLTDEQKANHDNYQRTPPFPSAKKIETITVGNPNIEEGFFTPLLIIGIVIAVIGIGMVSMGILPWGLAPFVIGVLMILWQLFA